MAEIDLLDEKVLEDLRKKLAPLYDVVDRICDEREMPRPPRF